ncbi:MAG: FAD-dependent oxidoreductase [Balneola sp.]|nr:FAD-dependent oxidoreductase [Balneola sp.]
MKKKVAVIGAGISGITTAVLLQQSGYEVSVYAHEHPLKETKNPYFSSLFPSASIIPHSVFHPDLNEIFKLSQLFFSKLHEISFAGLTKHEHFELFAFENSAVDYPPLIDGYETLTDLEWHPKHPDIPIKSGWKFNCFFADWTDYFPKLVHSFVQNNGTFINKTIDLNSYASIDEDIIINCSGLGSAQLINEDKSPLILKGHLLKVNNAVELKSPSGNTVSYNFSPGSDIYTDSFGTPFDVYCYPRKDDWILGGSRYKGTLDDQGNWISEDELSQQFPPQIESLNSEIIKETFGTDLSEFSEKEYQYSYRYVRNRKNGLRIESENTSDRLIIHNYGHGGAGVTLSWGCAFSVLQMIIKKTEISNTDITPEQALISLANELTKL